MSINLQRSASIQPRTSPKQKYEVSIMPVLLMFSPGHEEDHGDEEAEDDGEERG